MKVIPGINIQWPWSQLLITSQKTVETRSYPLPEKYIGRELAVIETPGKRGLQEAGITKARIIGTITFSYSKAYGNEQEWLEDRPRHRIESNDPNFKWSSDKPKYAWVVKDVAVLKNPIPAPKKRGIVFASDCKIIGL
jgi:hypothetical protein